MIFNEYKNKWLLNTEIKYQNKHKIIKILIFFSIMMKNFHAYPCLCRLICIVSIYTYIYPQYYTFKNLLYLPFPKYLSGYLISNNELVIKFMQLKNEVGCKGLNIFIFLLWVPEVNGIWTFPYPFGTDLPK